MNSVGCIAHFSLPLHQLLQRPRVGPDLEDETIDLTGVLES